MNRIRNLRSSIAVNIIGAIVFMLAVFGLVVSLLGLLSFTNSFQREYAVSTYHMADTAATLVNGDHIDEYLAGGLEDEYRQTAGRLAIYCRKMNVSLVYVIQVDTGDYGRFVSVFNTVNNDVDDTSYTPWELGFQRDTTNDEYRQKYEALYNRETAYETIYRIRTTDGVHSHVTTMVPVKDSAGEVVALLCIQRPAREVNNARKPYLRSIAASTLLLAMVSALCAVVYIRNHFVAPIQKVTNEAKRFARENTKGEPLDTISKYTEFIDLARSIDTMETDMVSYMENLTTVTADKERIVTELALANRIQAAMLPHVFPPFPDRSEFDLYATMSPAKEIGGDFYDFFLIDEDHLGMVMADVSGKGIPAALFMMASKIILQSCAMLGNSPAEILTRTNEAICSNNQEEMFITVWLGILEISTGTLTAANAGHEYPIVKHPSGRFEVYKDKHGFVIGGMAGVRYKEYQIRLEPGSRLFLYTDGLPEATDADNGMFGLDRTVAALNAAPDEPRALVESMAEAVKVFVGDAEQFDDLTMLCMQYNGPAPDKKSAGDELTLEARVENIPAATAFIDQRLEALDCSLKARMQIDVAMDEILSNIANYAYAPGAGGMTVTFAFREETRTAVITFMDRGSPFDPLAAEDPDVTLPAEDRPIGGLGILLVKKTMDLVTYERLDGKNILRIEKNI